jgi:predicted kinase
MEKVMSGDFTEQRFDYSGGREGAGELVVMVGISGSGKSTAVKAWVGRGEGKLVRLNRDDMRSMVYGTVPWEAHHDELIRIWQKDMARVALKKGKTVYIDDTNLVPRTRNDWELLAQHCYVRLRIITMNTPIEVCIKRDAERVAEVGEDVIRDQYKKFTKLTMSTNEAKSPIMTRPVFERNALNTGGWTTRLPGAPWVLVDVDGTLANNEPHRSPYDESKVLLDGVHEVVADWVRALFPFYNVCVVSGRKDRCGDDTCEWFEGHKIPFDHIFMRRTSDSRADYLVKAEILEELIAVIGKENIAFCLDDRPQVIEQCWKAYGIKVYPVRGGTHHSPNCPNHGVKSRETCACGALGDF